jgi:hypothetical protein
MLLIATAVVTPWLAAAMVGGTIKNIAQQGLDAAARRFRSVHRVIASGRSFGSLGQRAESDSSPSSQKT